MTGYKGRAMAGYKGRRPMAGYKGDENKYNKSYLTQQA